MQINSLPNYSLQNVNFGMCKNAKIIKCSIDPKRVQKNPLEIFEIYSKKLVSAVEQKSRVDKPSFSFGLKSIAENSQMLELVPVFNKKATWLAEKLVSLKSNDLAGMIYSLLVKLNYDNPKLREKYATNALAIAIRLNDSIHIMARANDLKELYKITAKGSDKHIKILYQEKRALNDILYHYKDLETNNKNRMSRCLAPKAGYLAKLAAIKVELGDLLKYKDPVLAKKELTEARDIYEQIGGGRNTEKIDVLLKKFK